MSAYHDAQHLIPHAPADDGGGGQDAPAPHFCGDCGEPIAHEGAACLNCAANACTGCGRMLDEFGQVSRAFREDRAMRIVFIDNDKGAPAGKLADAELHFDDGPLAGLRLIGFMIWQGKRGPSARNITFPARTYSVNGERRVFSLLRPVADNAQERLRDQILDAYAAHVDAQRAAVTA